MFHCTICHLFS